ncbi:MAG: hypothetical protein HYW51_01755 [Candidatus Doudnabacteria bacterium]|nr:hypothetical protein [Candidatus Doudnabacteria bacterium]
MKASTKRKIKKKSLQLTKQILVTLATAPKALFDIFIDSSPYTRRLFADREITRSQLQRAIQDLKRQRLIKMREYKQKLIYELTDLGRAQMLRWNYKFRPKQERRDGLGTIVIFDIPETKRQARDFLRRFLKENQFTQLQKSVFIGRFWLLAEFYDLLTELRIVEHVSVLEGRIPHTTANNRFRNRS